MKILLAIDGSPCSEAAVKEVAGRLWPADTQVRIISAIEPPVPLAYEPWITTSGDYFAETEKIERQHAEETVTRAAAKLRDQAATNKLLVSTQVLTGSPKQMIVEEAERWGADLIFVGSHGLKTWERILLGSISQAVATHAPCSVEIVRHR